jgi:chaperonin GroEL (HSP60 family)
VPNLESLTPEIKQYINELEKEYIERYNILVGNRIIYEEILEKYPPS